MKQEAINTFSDGLIMDLDPLTTPNTVLTNCLNGTFLTYDGHEFTLQNDKGNGRVETAYLPQGYVPIGMKEYGGIVYVVSYNPLRNESQVGCFPSPERNLSADELFGQDNGFRVTDTDFKGSNFPTKGYEYSYQRVDILPPDYVLQPGDEFVIQIQTEDNLDQLLTWYGTPDIRKYITIHLAVIDTEGNITYIEEELLQYKDTEYWMTRYNGETVDDYRANTKYQIFKHKTSGNLALIVELESIDTFELSRKIVSHRTTSNNKNPDGSIIANDSTYDVTWSVVAETSSLVNLRGVKFDYTLDNSTTGTRYITASNNAASFSGFGFTNQNIINYTVTPYTQFGLLEGLARSGGIVFETLGTGFCKLTEWKYYVRNDDIMINWGLDTDPLDEEIISRVTFSFYDFTVGQTYTNEYICKNRENYNGNFIDTLVFGHAKGAQPNYNKSTLTLSKDNFYFVTIKVHFLTKDGQVPPDDGIIQGGTKRFYRFLYTTPIFNEYYFDIDMTDFKVLEPGGQVTLDLVKGEGSSLEITPAIVTNDSDRTAAQLGSPPTKGYWEGKKVSTFTGRDVYNVELGVTNIANYFGEFNPESVGGTLSLDSVSIDGNPTYIGDIDDAILEKLALTKNEGESTDEDNYDLSFNPILETTENPDGSTSFQVAFDTVGRRGKVTRKIYATYQSEDGSVQGYILTPYFVRDDYVEGGALTNYADLSKRIGADMTYYNGGIRINGSIAGGGKNAGYLSYRASVSGNTAGSETEGYEKEYTGLSGMQKTHLDALIASRYSNFPTTVVLAGAAENGGQNGAIRLRANYQTNNINGNWPDPVSGSGKYYVSNYCDWMLVAWKTSTVLSGTVTPKYQFVNFGWKRGLNYDQYPSRTGVTGMAEAIGQVMSKLHLAQWRSSGYTIYYADLIGAHGQFNNDFTYSITADYGLTGQAVFRYFDIYSNTYRDFTRSAVQALLISKGLITSADIDTDFFNNIPADDAFNFQGDLGHTETISTGSEISMQDLFSAYQNSYSNITVPSEGRIIDPTGKTTDANGNALSRGYVYLQDSNGNYYRSQDYAGKSITWINGYGSQIYKHIFTVSSTSSTATSSTEDIHPILATTEAGTAWEYNVGGGSNPVTDMTAIRTVYFSDTHRPWTLS